MIDDIEKDYKNWNFNFLNIISLSDDEQVLIFGKDGENTRSYLRYKKTGPKTKKKLASLHIKPEHAQEIMSNAASAPEKLKKVLEKLERGSKPSHRKL